MNKSFRQRLTSVWAHRLDSNRNLNRNWPGSGGGNYADYLALESSKRERVIKYIQALPDVHTLQPKRLRQSNHEMTELNEALDQWEAKFNGIKPHSKVNAPKAVGKSKVDRQNNRKSSIYKSNAVETNFWKSNEHSPSLHKTAVNRNVGKTNVSKAGLGKAPATKVKTDKSHGDAENIWPNTDKKNINQFIVLKAPRGKKTKGRNNVKKSKMNKAKANDREFKNAAALEIEASNYISYESSSDNSTDISSLASNSSIGATKKEVKKGHHAAGLMKRFQDIQNSKSNVKNAKLGPCFSSETAVSLFLNEKEPMKNNHYINLGTEMKIKTRLAKPIFPIEMDDYEFDKLLNILKYQSFFIMTPPPTEGRESWCEGKSTETPPSSKKFYDDELTSNVIPKSPLFLEQMKSEKGRKAHTKTMNAMPEIDTMLELSDVPSEDQSVNIIVELRNSRLPTQENLKSHVQQMLELARQEKTNAKEPKDNPDLFAAAISDFQNQQAEMRLEMEKNKEAAIQKFLTLLKSKPQSKLKKVKGKSTLNTKSLN